MLLLLLIVILCFFTFALAKTITYDFDVAWELRAPDGFERPVMAVNGQWPCPTIEADLGDTVVVKAKNSLGTQTTSLHFHGMYQYGTAAYDGGVGTSQCPIEVGDSFTYTFKAEPAGTSWYHGHDKGQYPDGLRGILIVHDREWEKSLNIDEQIFLSMSDWYRDNFTSVIQKFLDPANRLGAIQPPDNFLFNETRDSLDLHLEDGKRYLIRLVSMSSLACGDFHIQGHKLNIVGVDGIQTEPYKTDSVKVCAGQRYDIVVEGKSDDTEDSQWITKMDTDMFKTTDKIPSAKSRTLIGNIRYGPPGKRKKRSAKWHKRSSGLDVGWKPSANSLLDDSKLKPLAKTALMKPVTREIKLKTNQKYYDGIGSRISMGGQPWTEPKVPTLYTALSTGEAAFEHTTYGPGVDPHIINQDDIVQVIFENPQEHPHPMHLHGHSFQLVARGSGSWDGDESKLPDIPMMRDTVMVPKKGYIVIRFKADNPGIWFFHCHIDLHLVGGMASTFIESPDLLQKHQSIPEYAYGICTHSGRISWGNCAGLNGSISATDALTECNTVWQSSYGSTSITQRKAEKL